MILLALLFACADPLPEGTVVDESWAVAASEMESALAVPCDGRAGGLGRYDVQIDDYSGWTVLVERDTGRVWLRDPFGVVPDRCWWLPDEGAANTAMENQDCASAGLQDGTCGRDASAPEGWVFRTPGVVTADPFGPAATLDGALLALSADGLERLDLTGTVSPPLDPSERLRTWLSWLPPLELPHEDFASGSVAVGADALLLYAPDRGRLWLHRRSAASLERTARRDVPGDGVLAASGGFAVVAAEGRAHVFSELAAGPRRDRRRHPALTDVRAAAVHPQSGDAWVLVPDGVVGLLADGTVDFHPTPGAEGLFVGLPGGVPTAYAWGNEQDQGVIYRLEAGHVAKAHRLDEPLLGAGTGAIFQEIVVVLERDGVPWVRGLLDSAHLDAIPDGTVGLAMAAFIESPRDAELVDPIAARRDAESFGGCETAAPVGWGDEHALCCVHALRASQAEEQLAWLDQRLQPDWPGGPAAVVLGVNPSAIAQSRLCAATGVPPLESDGAALPELVGRTLLDWQERGVGSAAVFGHSTPFDPSSWWAWCPDVWLGDVPSECWDLPQDDATFFDFYQAIASGTSLASWSEQEPDWVLFGGAFEGAELTGGAGWPDVFGDLVLPDGAVPDGLYFGGLGMNPRVPKGVAKELAPDNAIDRVFPVEVRTPAEVWDGGGAPTEAVYWPGQTIAQPYVYEIRRSGLLFLDFGAYVGAEADWASDSYRGEESPLRMNHADFAAQEHYLVTRVLAHKDVTTPRWWYFHLQDLSALRASTLGDGWVDCAGDCATDTELDRFLSRIAGWPQVRWTPTP